MSNPSPTRVLRRTLEDALDTHVASTVLFEALGTAKRIPESREDVLAVVRGPLREVLAKRLDSEQASVLVGRIVAQLAPLQEPMTVELDLDEFAKEGRREDATMAVPTVDRAVDVLVVAEGPGFGFKLEVALGERRVKPRTVGEGDALAAAIDERAPAILVVDASDFPTIDHAELILAGRELPSTSVCVLYGAELPYGKRLVSAIEAQDRHWVTLERGEGVAPLLDLIRSRRKSTPT